MYEYNAKLLTVIDADTMKLEVDLGFKVWMRLTFRLARINAPELYSFEGVAAKAFVLSQLTNAVAFKVASSRSEKYGRWLCEFLYQTSDRKGVWQNLNNQLLEAKHAVRYKH